MVTTLSRTKYGIEKHSVSVVFHEDEKDVETLLDNALAKIGYEIDNLNIKEDEDGCPNAEFEINIPCSVYYQDATWDEYGGNPPECETHYSGIELDEVSTTLKEICNAIYVKIDLKSFEEDF